MEGIYSIFGKDGRRLEGFWKEDTLTLEGVWKEYGRSMEEGWKEDTLTLEGVLKEYGRIMEGGWKDYGRIMKKYNYIWKISYLYINDSIFIAFYC